MSSFRWHQEFNSTYLNLLCLSWYEDAASGSTTMFSLCGAIQSEVSGLAVISQISPTSYSLFAPPRVGQRYTE